MPCEIVSELLVNFHHTAHLVKETSVILFLRSAPLHFAQCAHTWQEHVLQMFRGLDILGPEIGLYSQNVGSLLRSHLRRIWLERIDLLYIDETSDGERLILDAS